MPIKDFNEEELKSKLFDAASILNQMINEKGLKVYVHCSSGIGRAPAVVVAYLCIFKGMDTEESRKFVKLHRARSEPNMTAVNYIVNKYKKINE